MKAPGVPSLTSTNKILSVLRSTLLVSFYLALNSSLSVTNKWCLGWFPFPLVLTCSHMLFGSIALLPFMFGVSQRSQHVPTLKKQWKGVCCIGVFLGLNIALNNVAMADMTLSLNQIVRASMPVFACLITSFLKMQVPSRDEFTALLILAMGVMTTLWTGNSSGSSLAIACCLGSTVSNAAMMTTSEKLMSEKVKILQMSFYTGPISFLTVFPALILKEGKRFQEFQLLNKRDTITIMLSTSILALGYNLTHSLVIREFSAVTMTVIGEAKIVGLLILAATLLGERKIFTSSMATGTAVAVFGFLMYSQIKVRANLKQSRATDLQKTDDQEKLLTEASLEAEIAENQ